MGLKKMESMDFGEDVTEKLPKINWKPIAVIMVGVIVIGLLSYLALTVVNAAPVAMSFEENEVKPGENTSMKVVVVNTEDFDVEDVTLTILTEKSEVINVVNPSRTEVAMGSKTRREFDFDVNVNNLATPGTYKLTARVEGIGTEEKMGVAYLTVNKA